MNNLIDFIKRNFHFFLFAVLLVLSFVMLGKSMEYSRYKFALICQNTVGPIQKSWAEKMRLFSLGPENEELVRQNMELLREQENMFLHKSDTTLSAMSGTDSIHTTPVRLYDYSFAHVVYKTTDQAFNYIILDKGSKDGVHRDMAVTCPTGVVGVVSDVSQNFASVIPILHPDSRISAIISPINQVGTVVWEGVNPSVASVENIPQHLDIHIGDSVMTSGYSNIFPQGLLIGTVKEVKVGKNASFLTIKIRLSTDFKRLQTVYLIENLFKTEIDSLKAGFKTE